MDIEPSIKLPELLDLIIKAFAFVGFSFALYKYRTDWRRDFRKKINELKADCYWQIMDLSAKLLYNEYNTAAYKESRRTLLQILKGKVRIVQTQLLESAITNFIELMDKYHIDPSDFNRSKLDGGSYELAHLLRNDLASTWGIDFFNVQYRFVNPDDGSTGDSYLKLKTYRVKRNKIRFRRNIGGGF